MLYSFKESFFFIFSFFKYEIDINVENIIIIFHLNFENYFQVVIVIEKRKHCVLRVKLQFIFPPQIKKSWVEYILRNK